MLTFSNTGSGLITKCGEDLSQFAIAGADKKFVWATAKIGGDVIQVFFLILWWNLGRTITKMGNRQI